MCYESGRPEEPSVAHEDTTGVNRCGCIIAVVGGGG